MADDDRWDGRPPDEPLDRSPSSAALDPEHAAQDNSEDLRTGRHAYTPNATFIGEELPSARDDEHRWADEDPEDVPAEWESLNEANRRVTVDAERDPRDGQRQLDHENDIGAWGRRVGLTDYEVAVATYLYHATNGDERNGYGTEAIVLAALTLAANEDDTTRQMKILRHGAAPIAADTTRVVADDDMIERYEQIRTALGIERTTIRSCREHLRQYL